ncbi:UbiA family prenyltransferase [Lichenicoccus sp.]|uniref:UbiA family prenyltransferase n=1 Tax=Lichenicoccus sp. TaxID=2781899 RepID=UPI003D0B7D24
MPHGATRTSQDSAARLLPLAVDLDGTLLAGDVLHEQFVKLLLRRPLLLLRLFAGLRHGKAAFKRRMVSLLPPLAVALPFRKPFLDWLREQRQAGRSLHLVTASDQHVADAVAAHLGIFETATGSDGATNLRGAAKGQTLRARFPEGFVYAGDSKADLDVWSMADAAVLVNASNATAAQVRARGWPILAEFGRVRPGLRDWIAAIRLHQWSKNALLLVPLLLGHRFSDPHAVLRVLAAMLLLSVAASGTYILNDLADLEADRLHAKKWRRPFASGRLSPIAGLCVAVALIGGALVGGALLAWTCDALIAGYVAISLTYSLRLKSVPFLDTSIIAALFTLRLVLGIEMARVLYSPWLISFAGFFFLSLALAKRHVEVMQAAGDAGNASASLARRGYLPEDWPLTLAFGVAAAFASLQIMILFVADDAGPSHLYAHPSRLYLAPSIVALWLMRVWFLAHRKRLSHDPVIFALRDPVSWFLGVCILAIVLAAL